MLSEDYLDQMLTKADFQKLNVIGQFNKGFIICTLRNEQRGEVFILDQHACDEKFNFEKLSRTTELIKQDLMKPIKIQVSVTEALALNCHKDVFFKNGFKFTQVEGENTTFNLTSLPISKSVTFT